jgi:hypothetical protein
MPFSPPDTTKWWTNRRRHSYLAMFGLFALGMSSVIASPEQLSAAAPLMIALAWIFGAIILTYVGAATIEDVIKLKEFNK